MYTVIKDGKRKCIVCKYTMPVGCFSTYKYKTRQGKIKDRYSSRCKDCERARRKERYSNNRVHELALMKAHRVSNRDDRNKRLREYRADNVDKVRRQRVISEQKRRAAGFDSNRADIKTDITRVLEESKIGNEYIDAYSGTLIRKPTIDHIIPISKGGDSTYDNFCVTSRWNNTSKYNKPLIVWMAQNACH